MRDIFLTLAFFVSSFLTDARSESCSDPRSPYQIFLNRGTIQSPGYPDYYNANENCEWNLNPPAGRIPQLLIMSLVIETGIGYGEGATCVGVENYMTLDSIRACDKEGPVCLAFMLNTFDDYACHHVLMRHFSHCKSLLHNKWPMKVGFTTKDAHNMKGFQMNYTFIDCTTYRPPRPTVRSTTSATISSSTTTLNQGSVTKRNVTSPNGQAVNEPTNLNDQPFLPTDKSSPKTPTERTHLSRFIPTTSTRFSLIFLSRKTSTAIPQEDGSPQTGKTVNSTLIAVFIVLCVIFVILMVIFIFRRRIKEFTKTDKISTKFSTSPTNNNNIKVESSCVIRLEKALPYEVVKCPSPPSADSSPYLSTEIGEIPSISSTLIGGNLNNSHQYEYSHLNESIQSTISDECRDNSTTR